MAVLLCRKAVANEWLPTTMNMTEEIPSEIEFIVLWIALREGKSGR